MHCRKAVVVVVLLLVSLFVPADDKSTYEQLLKQGKHKELLSHLLNWEKKEPRNPEVYIGYFNYYLSVGRKEGVSLDKTAKPNANVLEIKDPKTGEIVAYMNPATIYDDKSIAQALSKLNEGLQYGTDRLDMYFGKIHILNEVFDYRRAGSTLIEVLSRSAINKNKWLWSNNEPVKDGEGFLLNNLQDYYGKWFELRSDEGIDIIRKACELQMKLYPRHNFAFANVGATYARQKNYGKALGYFLKAEQIDQRDVLVLSNIAVAYINLGKTDKAREYYKKITSYGTPEEKKYAEEQLSRL